jgi:FSR family fosmidomycin resistance protein-like MFS transporter
MTSAPSTIQPKAYIAVLLVLGSTHLLNDLIQALIPAIYPIIKDKYALDFLAMVLMIGIARQHTTIRTQFLTATSSHSKGTSNRRSHSPPTVWLGLGILSVLMFSKLAYVESFRSFYTFYLIDRFGVSIATSQLMLFIFFVSSAAGVLLGGIVGDRIGRYGIIWISILGPLPLTLLLPHVNFFWTGVLTILINLIMASAFASIMIYAMELVSPNRIGLVGGLFYGLNFGMGGIAAAILGGMADSIGIERVYQLCSFLPLAGLLTLFLPRITDDRTTRHTKSTG